MGLIGAILVITAVIVVAAVLFNQIDRYEAKHHQEVDDASSEVHEEGEH